MNGYRCDEDIIQNLRDAGCEEATIQDFMDYLHCGKYTVGEKLLEKHRRCLLEDLRAEQKKIDCLDYLIYVMRKKRQ